MMPQEMTLDDDWEPPEDGPALDLGAIEVTPMPPWFGKLSTGKGGGPRRTFGNICTVLRHAEEYASLRFNEMSGTPELDGAPIYDARLGAIREAIEAKYELTPAVEALSSAILTVSDERKYHPVREYLDGLRWDGVERLGRIARDYFGAEPTTINATLCRLFLVSAVARTMEPGCKADTCLVLAGPQGVGKSQAFSILAGEWFSDTALDVTSKDALMQLAGVLVYEIAELDHVTSKAHEASIKNFMTSKVDRYRPPYGRAVQSVPRRGIMVGTTNQAEFLSDDTGSRRFWPVRVTKIDLDALRRDRDQLWAEATHAYRSGEKWYLKPVEDDARHAAAEEYRKVDPWEPKIAAWLDSPSRNVAEGPLTSERILGSGSAIDMPVERQEQRHKNRVHAVMVRLGYSVKPTRVGGRTVRVWHPAVTPSHSDDDDRNGL